MRANRLWYVKRGDSIRGPYPSAQIKRAIKLGRLRPDDLLGEDQQHWRPLRDYPVFHDPDLDGTIEYAIVTADERIADRRGTATVVGADQRITNDRRQPEDIPVVAARNRRAQVRASLQRVPAQRWPLIVLIMLVLATLIAAPFVYKTTRGVATAGGADCNAGPQPNVRWDSCDLRARQLEAVDLSNASLAYADLSDAVLAYSTLDDAKLTGVTAVHADLRYARLNRADLSYADLRDALLDGADLTGARLDNAVWLDGRLCGRNSIGVCSVVGE